MDMGDGDQNMGPSIDGDQFLNPVNAISSKALNENDDVFPEYQAAVSQQQQQQQITPALSQQQNREEDFNPFKTAE